MLNFKSLKNYAICLVDQVKEIKLTIKSEIFKRKFSSYINSCTRLDLCSSVVDDFPIDLWSSMKIEHIEGFSISVREFYQYKIYDGILVGYPRETTCYIDHALKTAIRIFPDQCEKAHILPAVVSYGQTRLVRDGVDCFTYDFEVLPPTASMAVLQSSEASEYVFLIWFQNQLGQIDAEIIEQIKNIEWHSYAVEFGH
jgi:hypothetical protein